MASNARAKNEEEEIAKQKRSCRAQKKNCESFERRVCWRVEDYKNRTGKYSKEIVHVLKYTKWLEIYKSKGIVSAKYIFIINTNKNMEINA